MSNNFLADMGLFAIAALLGSVALTWITLQILRRRAILDLPNERSSHTRPTPRGGGWGVMLALLPFWVWATWRTGRFDDPSEMFLLAGVALLIAVSWIDDRRGLGPGIRFAAQFLAAGSVMAALPADLSLSGGLLPIVADRLIATLAWLWFVNLFNFMDGIDGISGGSAGAMGLGLMLVWLRHGPDPLEAFRGDIIAAASVGFLIWNWQPAKIFLGDVGSIPLGYLLGYGLVRLAMDQGRVLALIIAAYYLADATITLLRRAFRGERIWQAHRQHFYQRAVQYGRTHAETARMAILAQVALAVMAWLETFWGPILLIPAALMVAVLLRWMARPPRRTTLNDQPG